MNSSSVEDPGFSPSLHVFEQEGGWHWGITVPRAGGSGFKVVAYSEETFDDEAEAHREGNRALARFAHGRSVAYERQ
jgi:hypothetical protein